MGYYDLDHSHLHGYDNLHIAGSPVFTTGRWANPTLTLLALVWYHFSRDNICSANC